MKWTHYDENVPTNEFVERWESEAGEVLNHGATGWTAWLTLPGQRAHLIGDCYSTATSARAAIMRQWRKHAPLEVR